MKISYNWLKWYIPECPSKEKLYDVFTYHLCEVEGTEDLQGGDTIFDINILPNRAHDLLSHQGIARELASLLDIPFVSPIPQYKIPESVTTNFKVLVEAKECRRYMGRVVRNVSVGASPEWVVKHLESIGQRSINNIVDAANITMYDSGQPIHAFDLDKIKGSLVVRFAKDGEEITTLDNKQVKLKDTDLVIADEENVLAIAGVKGGKIAEVDNNTKNIVIEVANFDPVTIRKTRSRIGIFTDAAKRFENDLSLTYCDLGMLEMSALLVEYGFKDFESIIDIYPNLEKARTLKFSLRSISNKLGIEISPSQIENILNRYQLTFKNSGDEYEIEVPMSRLDLSITEDITEEVGRVLGYDKLNPKIPKLNFTPKINEVFAKTTFAREKLLNAGFSEVMTYAFTNTGDTEVLASASDKKFLRTNLKEGLLESVKLNQNNSPLLNQKEVKVFEIGKVFKDNKEILNIAYGDKKGIIEMSLDEYMKASENSSLEVLGSPRDYARPDHQDKNISGAFSMWSLFPFITRDIAVWVSEVEGKDKLENLIKENLNELCVKGPTMFDSFTKEGRTSYGFRMVFQAYDRTLTDIEINQITDNITNKIKENENWQVR